MVCHFLLQGIFPARDQIPVSYVSCMGRRVLYHQCHLGSPRTFSYHTLNMESESLFCIFNLLYMNYIEKMEGKQVLSGTTYDLTT